MTAVPAVRLIIEDISARGAVLTRIEEFPDELWVSFCGTKFFGDGDIAYGPLLIHLPANLPLDEFLANSHAVHLSRQLPRDEDGVLHYTDTWATSARRAGWTAFSLVLPRGFVIDNVRIDSRPHAYYPETLWTGATNEGVLFHHTVFHHGYRYRIEAKLKPDEAAYEKAIADAPRVPSHPSERVIGFGSLLDTGREMVT